MQNWFQSSIRNKIATVVLVAVVAAVCLASIISAWRDSSRRLDAKERELHGIAAALAATVSEPLKAGDSRSVGSALRAMGSIPGLEFVRVSDAGGKSVFQLGTGVVVGLPEPGAGWIFNLETFPVEVPIIHGGERIGTLTLLADVSELRDALVESLMAALSVGVLSALCGLLAVQRLQRSVTEPILALKTVMEATRLRHDYALMAERTSRDETGALVDAFNQMIADIRARDAALARHRDRLEQDVAERTRELAVATAAAQSANAAKSEFLATMSHEIRTPMNAMLVMAELLAADDLAPHARRRSDVIVKSGRLLLSIINDILDLSKIEAGQLTLETVPVDPGAMVEEVLELFAERARSEGLDLACYIAGSTPLEISGDPVRITQIISNLVNNALKFTSDGGVLVSVAPVKAADGQPWLRFEVSDTGIGIAADKAGAIFEAFTQAEQSTTRRFGGTGIGLAICRRLVAAMGGSIGVESKLGEGSTFWFEIPGVRSGAARAAETPPRPVDAREFSILVRPGPVQQALVRLCDDLGLRLADGSNLDGHAVVIADMASFRRSVAEGTLPDAPVLLIAELDDSAARRAVESHQAYGLVTAPIGGRATKRAIIEALEGKPVADEPAGRSSRATRVLADASLAGVRVLAADDNEANREVIAEALKRLGAVVTCVEDGFEAVAAARAEKFDLIFMDGSMPGMDGFDAARKIRDDERLSDGPSVPIVALTAHVFGKGADAWQSAGMSGYLAKPFTLAQLRSCVEQWALRTSPIPATHRVADWNADTVAARPVPAPDAEVLVDFDVLQSIAEMQAPGDDLVGRVIGLFVEHAPRLAERVRAAGNSDPETLANAAHALKSLCRNIGAVAAGDLCGEIEEWAVSGEPGLAQRVAQLPEKVDATIACLVARQVQERAA